MPGLQMIKTSDKGLIANLCRMKIPVKHTSGSLIPGEKVWFFEVSDKFIDDLPVDEKKLITITKQSEIDGLIRYPKHEHPVTRMGDDILVAELEKRGFIVEKKKGK